MFLKASNLYQHYIVNYYICQVCINQLITFMSFVIIYLMGDGYHKKKVGTSPIIPEPANDGLRLLARMIVQSLLRQQTENNLELGEPKQVKIPPETNS